MAGKPRTEDLVRACDKIIDAASALIADVETLADLVTPAQEHEHIVDDARTSVQRIVKLARAMRGAIEGKKVDREDLG